MRAHLEHVRIGRSNVTAGSDTSQHGGYIVQIEIQADFGSLTVDSAVKRCRHPDVAGRHPRTGNSTTWIIQTIWNTVNNNQANIDLTNLSKSYRHIRRAHSALSLVQINGYLTKVE